MKLVLFYTASDGCTWSCENTHPIEYDSAEQAYIDLENLVKNHIENNIHNECIFAGYEILPEYMYDKTNKKLYHDVEILTIDEWFKRNNQ